MAIELTCPGCSRTLRVPDEHAGKQARCPECGVITTIPFATSSAPAAAPPPSFAPNPFSSPGDPFANQPVTPPSAAPNPYASPQIGTSFPSFGSYVPPHRGSTILAFGIVGLLSVCCCLFAGFGIAAIVMGQSDMAAMRIGRMDPSGRGLTQAGLILGIISCVLAVIVPVLNIVIQVGAQ